jgi:hypothetical protein
MNEILKFIARPDRFLLLLILCCFHSLAFADLNTGLVAYWSFDDE